MLQRTCLLLAVFAAMFAAGSGAGGQAPSSKPPAPLVLAAGEGVSLAFALPAKPRPHGIQVLRATKESSTFAVAAEIDASALTWVDDNVVAGRTYVYAIRTVRDGQASDISPTVEVTVGGSARITLLGGSLERALFEVVIFRQGKRLASRFVHKPGDKIGDLAWVEELDGVADFRLGPVLATITLTQSEAVETQREVLKRADGGGLTDLAGRPIELAFKVPTHSHEVVQVRLLDAQGRPRFLREGETLAID